MDVKIAGKPAVRVAVGHGVEERKPLLSLFVTRDRREWIGWTPGGPFDRSSDNAEAFIGWHVNTGKPEQPVTFVAAGQYKGEFYKPNILKLSDCERQSVGRAERVEGCQAPPPDPELSPGINGANRDLQRPDLFHVRQKNVKLTATLITAAYPLDAGDEVLWQAVGPDGKKVAAQPMKHVRDRSWEADLSALPWKQGEFHIEVLFRSERYDKKTSQALTLRYQPPAPRSGRHRGEKRPQSRRGAGRPHRHGAEDRGASERQAGAGADGRSALRAAGRERTAEAAHHRQGGDFHTRIHAARRRQRSRNRRRQQGRAQRLRERRDQRAALAGEVSETGEATAAAHRRAALCLRRARVGPRAGRHGMWWSSPSRISTSPAPSRPTIR